MSRIMFVKIYYYCYYYYYKYLNRISFSFPVIKSTACWTVFVLFGLNFLTLILAIIIIIIIIM
jgi:hypothetical protein